MSRISGSSPPRVHGHHDTPSPKPAAKPAGPPEQISQIPFARVIPAKDPLLAAFGGQERTLKPADVPNALALLQATVARLNHATSTRAFVDVLSTATALEHAGADRAVLGQVITTFAQAV